MKMTMKTTTHFLFGSYHSPVYPTTSRIYLASFCICQIGRDSVNVVAVLEICKKARKATEEQGAFRRESPDITRPTVWCANGCGAFPFSKGSKKRPTTNQSETET